MSRQTYPVFTFLANFICVSYPSELSLFYVYCPSRLSLFYVYCLNRLSLWMPYSLSSIVLHRTTILTYYHMMPWSLVSMVLFIIPGCYSIFHRWYYTVYLIPCTMAYFIHGLMLRTFFLVPFCHYIFHPCSYAMYLIPYCHSILHLWSYATCRCHDVTAKDQSIPLLRKYLSMIFISWILFLLPLLHHLTLMLEHGSVPFVRPGASTVAISHRFTPYFPS